MSQRQESKWWNSIRPHFKGKVTRIESWATSGVPDVHGCCQGKAYWVETKVVPKGNNAKLRTMQIGWHMSYAEHGGNSWILVKWEEHGVICLYRGALAVRLDEEGFKGAWPACNYPLGSVDWNVMMRVILHGQ